MNEKALIAAFETLQAVCAYFCRLNKMEKHPAKTVGELFEKIEHLVKTCANNQKQETKIILAEIAVLITNLANYYAFSLGEAVAEKIEADFYHYNPILWQQLKKLKSLNLKFLKSSIAPISDKTASKKS